MSFTNETDKQKYYIEKCRELIAAKEQKIGRKLTACVVTFGCQMNFKDSEKLMGILSQIGYQETDDEHADLVLYNTCTVRENANLKIYGRLGYLSKIKEKNPEMIIGLCGCMMQEPQVVEKLNKSYRFVDIIFGTHNVFQLAELLYDRLIGGHRIEDIWDGTTEIVEDLPTIRKYDFKSGVNIMYGCNNFCSYCIVPYVRGRERSRKPEDIINEIKKLVSEGVVEIMLLGQNVNSYGKGLDGNVTFASLLREIEKIDGLQRIRFMTPHPKDLSDEVIEVMANSKKICRHIHLPAQSGSSNILKKMNRNYTREDYLALVDKIKTAMPDISITTDLIVGFPGETEEDFEDTLSLVKEVGYSSAFTFQYSKRTGTPAATFEDQVPEEVMTERFNRLLETVKESSGCNDDLAGKTMDVLVEGKNEKLEGYLSGRLSNNMLVHFKGDEDLIGKIIDVHIDESKGFYYFGTIV